MKVSSDSVAREPGCRVTRRVNDPARLNHRTLHIHKRLDLCTALCLERLLLAAFTSPSPRRRPPSVRQGHDGEPLHMNRPLNRPLSFSRPALVQWARPMGRRLKRGLRSRKQPGPTAPRPAPRTEPSVECDRLAAAIPIPDRPWSTLSPTLPRPRTRFRLSAPPRRRRMTRR
jgi:hypothetical protein